MKIQVKYFQDLPLCTAPFTGKCLEIYNGIQASKTDANDLVYFNRTQYVPNDYEVVTLKLKKGDVVFYDLDRQAALYRLPSFFVTADKVAKVVSLMAKFDYDAGAGGYITSDSDGTSVWVPGADLNNPDFATKLGLNPVFSVLELFDNAMTALFGEAFEAILNAVPPELWVVGSGFAAYRSYKTLPKGKKTLKSIKPETIGWGAGAGYAAWRAYKSAQYRKANG